MKAMILAAGLGTRLKPFTDHHPKALAPIGEHTLLELAIKKLIKADIKDIVINVHHFADQIIDYVAQHDNFGAHIQISNEIDEVLETGGGLKKALSLLGTQDDVLVCNADILSNIDLKAMMTAHQKWQPATTLAVQDRTSSRKLIFNNTHQLIAWCNETDQQLKPADVQLPIAYKKLAFSGIQIIHPQLLQDIQLAGKFSLIDMYLQAMNRHAIRAYEHSNDVLLDVGKPEAHKAAQELIKELL